MSAPRVNPDWLRSLRASAVQPPRQLRQPLWVGESVIGSVEANFFSQIRPQPSVYMREQLSKEEQSGIVGWAHKGEVTATFNEMALLEHPKW